MALVANFLIRILIRKKLGLEATGCYQAAWTLGGLYVGFILEAMAADFFPRLTSVISDNRESNRMVNEQAEIGLLMAGPGLLATLTFSPLVIQIFYSGKFQQAVEILRWTCVAEFMRVASWPLGFIVVAKGRRWLFFVIQFFGAIAHVGLVAIAVYWFGLRGTGIAFLATFALCLLLLYGIAAKMTGFRWSQANRRITFLFTPLIATVILGLYLLPPVIAVILGAAVSLGAGIYSLKTLCSLIPVDRLPGPARKLVILFRLAPPSPLTPAAAAASAPEPAPPKAKNDFPSEM